MTQAGNATDPEKRQPDHRRLVASAFFALAIALLAAAGWLALWSLGRGLTTPGGEADLESELLGVAAILVASMALAALVGASSVWTTGWPLSRSVRIRILVAFAIAVIMFVLVPMIRLWS